MKTCPPTPPPSARLTPPRRRARPRNARHTAAAAIGILAFLAAASLAPPVGARVPAMLQDRASAPPPGSDAALQEIGGLFNQGVDALNHKDYPAAEKAFKAAYDRSVAINDLYSMGIMLDTLATVYLERGDTDQALETKHKAIDILRSANEPKPLGRALINLAVTCNALGEYDDGIAAAEESRAIYQGMNDQGARAEVLLLLGDLYRGAGHYEKARIDLQSGLDIRKTIDAGARPVADAYNELGMLDYALAHFDEARTQFESALKTCPPAVSADMAADSLDDLATIATAQGHFNEAMDDDNQALALRQQGVDPEAVAMSFAHLSNVYYALGRYDVALFYSRRALAIGEQTGSKSLIAAQLLQVGSEMNALGQDKKATDFLTRAIDLFEQVGDDDNRAIAVYDLGFILYDEHDYAGAIKLFQSAAPIAEQRKDYAWAAQILSSTAMAEDSLGQPAAALDLFLQAHALYQKVGNDQDLARSYNNLGGTYKSLGKYDEAADALTKSLDLKSKIGNPQDTANSESNLAMIEADRGHLDHAAALMKDAIKNIEVVRDQIAAPSEIGTLQDATLGDIYVRYALVLLHMQRPGDALVQIESGRGQGLARQAAQSRSAWPGVLSAADAKQLADATNALRAADADVQTAQKQSDKLEDGDADEDSQTSADHALDDARRVRDEAQQQLSQLRDRVAARNPDYQAMCGLDAPTIATYTALAKAHPDTLYLTWAVGPDAETVLFAIRADTGVRAFSIPVGRTELTQRVADWRNDVAPDNDEGGPGPFANKEQREAQALYDTLLGPAEKAGLLASSGASQKTQRLVVIGDGPLRDLPFAALEDAGGRQLIQRFPLSTGISLRLLALPSRPPGAHSSAVARGILCVADPGGGDAKNTSADELDGFAPLPASRIEGRMIAALFPGGATTLIGDDATHDAVMAHLANVRLLHFSTHGYLDDENGLSSGLLIAPPPIKPGMPMDDALQAATTLPLLTAEEILDHPLSAELATLSACETGRGEHSGGEGLLGLVWAFQAAGCPSVVASQWSVEDGATAMLMVRFYQDLRAGRRRDDALRDAMLFVRAQDGKSAPFYWAAFQLNGEAGALYAGRVGMGGKGIAAERG
jgi:CHAT domain-containing protein/uncharacterized protein HemY